MKNWKPICALIFSLSLLLSYSLGSPAQSADERSPLCERDYLIETVKFLDRSDLSALHFDHYLSQTQSLITSCRSSLTQLGFSSRHLAQVEQNFRLQNFAAEEKKFFERRSLLSPRELIDLGKLANQRPEALNRKYNEFLNRKKSECTAVDLRPKLPPVRDQDSVGWCFAYVAADLASFAFGKEISAVGLAVGYNQTKRVQPLTFFGFQYGQEPTAEYHLPESQLRGGEVETTIREANKSGYCLESEVPSDDFAYSELKSNLEEIESLAQNKTSTLGVTSLRTRPNTQIMNPSSAAGAATTDPRLSGELCEPAPAHTMTPGLDIFEFDKILQESDSSDVVKNLVQKACKNPIRSELKTVFTTENLADQTHQLLNEGRPTSLSYDANVLLGRPVSPQADHGSLVVGRRWNSENQKCELLIRNSWGTTCAPYSYPCEDGNIWIPDHIMMHATTEMTYVEK